MEKDYVKIMVHGIFWVHCELPVGARGEVAFDPETGKIWPAESRPDLPRFGYVIPQREPARRRK